MWGVGCIFYEMATGWPLFPGSTVEEELTLIFKRLGNSLRMQFILLVALCLARGRLSSVSVLFLVIAVIIEIP